MSDPKVVELLTRISRDGLPPEPARRGRPRKPLKALPRIREISLD